MILRSVFAAVAAFFFFSTNTAVAEMGALAKYRGDWMIDKNFRHLVATRWSEGSDSLEMRYSYTKSHCIRWTRKTWVMRYRPATHDYTAEIRGRTTESATGHWDKSSNTMTWTIGPSGGGDDTPAKPRGVRRIVHAFGDGNVKWTTEYKRADGSVSTLIAMDLDLIVPFEQPTQ